MAPELLLKLLVGMLPAEIDVNDRDSSSNQILFSLIRYVTETIRSVSVFFSDSEDEPADPNIIYEEPDDEASSSDKDVSDATLPARTELLFLL